MSIVSFKTIKGSAKSAHQQIEINDQIVGEVWREQARVIVSKLSQPLRQEMRWRWFAKATCGGEVLGRGRTGLAGPGFPSKDKAVDALDAAMPVHANRPRKNL